MNLIPGRNLGVREKILAMPSVGVGGKAHVCRNKCADLASSKISSKELISITILVIQSQQDPNGFLYSGA